MRKLILALVGVAGLLGPLALIAPADAATSSAPTMYAPNVARGKTIPVRINAHGSKIVSKSNTLWKSGHRRVYDWSPAPGLYNVKSVIRYRIKKTTSEDVWVPDAGCEGYSYEHEGFDENGDGDYDDTELGEYGPDAYDACAPDQHGYWDERDATTYGPIKRVTRYDYARVHTNWTPGCVNYREFKAVKNGMTQTRVHYIFGARGRLISSGSGGSTREYQTCEGNEWSSVEVYYDPRVWFKWRYIDWS